MPNMVITLPKESIKKMQELKSFFQEESDSTILAIGIEILNWIKDHNEEYKIIAQHLITKETEQCPLVKLKNK